MHHKAGHGVMGSWDHGPVFGEISATQQVKKLNLTGSFDVDTLGIGAHTAVVFVSCTIWRKELLPEVHYLQKRTLT